MRLKNSSKISARCNAVVEKVNARLLKTVIKIFKTNEEY
jgi:hypothetical protein